MDIKDKFKNTTSLRYFEWFSDKEPFVFPPKDALDAAMRKAKKDIQKQKSENRSQRIVEAVSQGKSALEAMKEIREEGIKSAKEQEIIGFQFKDV
jgi:hypothetical protein